MQLLYKLLSDLNCKANSISDIDNIKYADYHIEYTLPDIVDFNWKNILSNPPKNSSKQTLEELVYLSKLTQGRSQQDLDLIKSVDSDAAITVKNVLKKHKCIFPNQLFDKLYLNTKYIIYNIKFYYNRPRPKQLANIYNIDLNVIESDTARTPAYPSGHTVYARLAANVSLRLYPHLQTELDDAVNLVAYARCCQGVHFPSDNQASIILGNFLYNNLISKIKV